MITASRQPSAGLSYFGDNQDASRETHPVSRPQGHQEPTAGFAAQHFSSNHLQNPAAHQYGLGPIPATNGHNMPQSIAHSNQFADPLAFHEQIASGQRAGSGSYPVYNYPSQPMQGYPDARALRPPQGQLHYPQANAPQGPQNGPFPQQPQYRNISGPLEPRVPSQYEHTGQMAPIQGNMLSQVGRPSTAPVPAAENPQSLISIIQQLKDLGVISVPGQDNNPKGRKKTASGHRQTCPQNGDKPVNPACLKHGDHAQSAQQHLATWMTGGNPDLGMSYAPFLTHPLIIALQHKEKDGFNTLQMNTLLAPASRTRS